MRFFLVLLLFLSYSIAFSQSKEIKINWDGNRVFSTSTSEFEIPFFDNYNYNFTPSNGISLVAQWTENSGVDYNSIVIEKLELLDISEDQLMDLDTKTIPDEIKYNITTSIARGKTYLFLELNPIIHQNGSFKKSIHFSFHIKMHL